MELRGAMTALVTPFTATGEVDIEMLRAHVKRQIEAGIDALVPVGTTGESPTLTHDEHRRVIEVVVEVARDQTGGMTPVIAGTGSNSTHEAVAMTRHAKDCGADAALVVAPYYNKPTQEGLYRHYSTIADVGLPIILYNIPGRCGVELTVDTVVRLSDVNHVIAIKEATGKLDVASEIASRCGLTILSGDDSLTLPLMSVGATGVISVLANLLPERIKALTTAVESSDFDAARKLHLELFPVFKAIFLETNPIPIKAAMHLAGLDSGMLRLPMCPMSEGPLAKMTQVLTSAGAL